MKTRSFEIKEQALAPVSTNLEDDDFAHARLNTGSTSLYETSAF